MKTLRKAQLNNRQTQRVTQFYKDDGQITMKDLRGLVRRMNDLGSDAFDYFRVTKILVQNGQRWITFKDEDELAEYYRGKVRDERKFFNFNQVQITSYCE
jgi:hypothetical protein